MAGRTQVMCPACGYPAPVATTGPRRGSGALPRTRACSGPLVHTFHTLEQVAFVGLDIRALVRQSGDKGLRPFDSRRLEFDLERFVSKTLLPSERRAIVDEALTQLEHDIDTVGERISRSGRRQRDDERTHILEDKDVRAAMGRTLKRHGRSRARGPAFRTAHILYGLATFGAVHHGPGGFQSARDVLAWIDSEYPGSESPVPIATMIGRRSETWWPPNADLPTIPRQVVKRRWHPIRFASEDPQRDRAAADKVEEPVRQDFDGPRFRRSVRYALAGRGADEEMSGLVSAWVLWGLVGQQTVQTAQLAAGVTECLRRYDDIAYLRWVAIAKGLSVRQVREEAVELMLHPSPRLVFDGAATPILR